MAGLVVGASVLAIGLLSSPAGAATTPPNLTGSWYNVQAPTAPAWALQASANLSELSATWNGSITSGHAGLVGDANGLILNLARTTYAGRYSIREGGADFLGDMQITIVTPNQIKISLQGDNGASATYTFARSVASVVPPAASWCTSLTAVGSSCETNPIPLAAGEDAIEPSPDFTIGQTQATVSVSGSGDSAANLAAAAATTPAPNKVIHAADCATIAIHETAFFIGDDFKTEGLFESFGNQFFFVASLLACLDNVHRAQGTGATAVSVSCPVAAFRISFHAASGSVSYRRQHGRLATPVRITCRRTSTGFTVHFKSGASLRSVFGKRLLLGIYHSRTSASFATVTAAFSNH